MFKLIILITALFSVTAVQAQTTLHLQDADKYSVETRSLIYQYLNEVQSYLPSQISFINPLKIQVRFTDMPGSPAQMLKPSHDSKIKMGSVRTFASNKTVSLNKNILSLYGKDFYAKAKSQRHENGRRLAIATLLHEVSHIIDLETPFSAELQSDIQRCKDKHAYPDYTAQYFKSCSHALGARGGISNHPDFLRQVRWDNIKKSEDHPGSPNNYEYENSNEFFAVNFEYFLLDPLFQCRRPSLFQIYKNIFKWAPSYNENCDQDFNVFFHNKPEMVNLKPSRIVQISYLHAGRGEVAMSRWGHSMLRLTVCKQDLLNEADQCPRNTQDVVIGFQAQITNNTISNLDGLIGNYASKLFVLDYKKVVDDYSKNEFREVFTYALKISKEQKKQLAYKILETYWGYAGRYYFITNNCASETLSLLQSVLNSKQPLNKEIISTPIGLLAALKSANIIDPQENQKTPSYAKTLNTALGILNYRTEDGTHLSLDAYFKMTSAQRLFILGSKNHVKEKAAFQILESFLLSKKMNELDARIFEISMKQPNETVKRSKSINFVNSDSSYSYGIPTTQELTALEKYIEVWESNVQRQQQVLAGYKNLFPELRQEIQEIQNNITKSRSSQ